MNPGRAIALAFGPDTELPIPRIVWGLIGAAVILPLVGWLLGENDEPNDLGSDDDD